MLQKEKENKPFDSASNLYISKKNLKVKNNSDIAEKYSSEFP